MDLYRARQALEKLIELPNVSSAVRYYARLALSHMQDEADAKRVLQADEARRE